MELTFLLKIELLGQKFREVQILASSPSCRASSRSPGPRLSLFSYLVSGEENIPSGGTGGDGVPRG